MAGSNATIWECTNPRCDWWRWGRESDEVDSCPVCEWPIVSDRWAAMMTRAEQEWESRDGR